MPYADLPRRKWTKRRNGRVTRELFSSILSVQGGGKSASARKIAEKMVQSDAEVIKDLKAEVAALRRVIDNNNAKIAISSMQMNEMKTRVAK